MKKLASILTFTLLIILPSIACQLQQENKITNEKFDEFIELFKSNEEFQLKRVIFPLQVTYFQDFHLPDLDTIIVKKDYYHQSLLFQEDCNYKILDTNSSTSFKTFEITGQECGIYVRYYFKTFDNKWYLIKIVDQSN